MSDLPYIKCMGCTASVPNREQAVLCGWHCRDGVWACDNCFNGKPSEPGAQNNSVNSPTQKG